MEKIKELPEDAGGLLAAALWRVEGLRTPASTVCSLVKVQEPWRRRKGMEISSFSCGVSWINTWKEPLFCCKLKRSGFYRPRIT